MPAWSKTIAPSFPAQAVPKHRGYVTLVMNGITGELLYLAEGKK